MLLTAETVIVSLVSAAGKVIVPLSLSVYFVAAAAMSISIGTCCAGLSAAVSVADVGGEELLQAAAFVPSVDSQMLVGLTVSVRVARWSAAVSPYLRAGYCDAVPRFHGSCVPVVTESRSMSQSL